MCVGLVDTYDDTCVGLVDTYDDTCENKKEKKRGRRFPSMVELDASAQLQIKRLVSWNDANNCCPKT
jgi:hypothetical protein